ncbi:MAG: carbohydrate ABC transporter permease [Mobilitalea sp.]
MKEKGSTSGIFFRRFIAYIVLGLLTVVCLFSFYILLVNCTRNNVEIQRGFSLLPGDSIIRNFNNLMDNNQLPVFTGIVNSFIVAAGSAILTTYFSALTAYAIHAYDFKFKRFAFTFILLIMMVPAQVSALGFIKLMRSWDLLNNFIPLIVPSIAAPVVFFYMKQYMESALPLEIVEAARIDGAPEFRAFNKIVLPIMKPAIAVQMIFAFTGSWNNYFIPSLILNKPEMKTLPLLIAQLRSADFLKFDLGQVYMMIAISIFPVVIVYLFLSRSIVQGIAIGSIKG